MGLVPRTLTREDVVPVTALIAAFELADDGTAELGAAEVAAISDRPDLAPADTLAVFDGGTLIGWGDVYQGRAEADVTPSRRGRGLGAKLLAWTEERARARAMAEVR